MPLGFFDYLFPPRGPFCFFLLLIPEVFPRRLCKTSVYIFPSSETSPPLLGSKTVLHIAPPGGASITQADQQEPRIHFFPGLEQMTQWQAIAFLFGGPDLDTGKVTIPSSLENSAKAGMY